MRFDDFGEPKKPPRGVDPYVLPTITAMLIAFTIFAPKIYIANEIYLISLKIERNKLALEALKDANSRLNRKMEAKIIAVENPFANE
ncbi:MAG: hypothetical protein LBP89_06125 [Helicobacteraceae bacterium]|jgi:hypothetical protein|nr:hypothetical protein [Helicobacteraceae bacterium]